MAKSNFVVKTGLTVGSLNIYAVNGNLTTSGTISANGNLVVTGDLYWSNGSPIVSGVPGSPSGSDTQLQYNNAGNLAGATGLTTDGTNLKTIGGAQLMGYITGPVGANVANTGAFTTMTASSTLAVSGTANFAGTVTAATVNATAIGNTNTVVNANSVTTTGDVSIGGNLTVSGTQTVVNSTTVSVNDLNLVLANNAASAAAADGAGITVNGASATITYTNATTSWNFNKAIIGTGGIQNTVIGNGTAAAGTFTTLTSSGVISAAGNIHANSNTASTSQTTGALVVTGGLGVSGTANVGNVITSSGVYYANGTVFGSSPSVSTQQIFTYTAPTGTFARAASMNGSHTRTSTTLTVSLTNHGFIVGDRIYGDMTSGTVADQWVTVATVPNVNAFTCTIASASGSAGNSTWYPPIVITANGHGLSTSGDVFVDFSGTYDDNWYTVYQATTNTFQVQSGTTAIGNGSVNLKSLNSSQTWTKPSGCKSVWVRVVGGGSAPINGTNHQATAGGGYSEEIIDVSAISSVAVTVGLGALGGYAASGTRQNGGTSSFGAYLSATGGSSTAGVGVGGSINVAGFVSSPYPTSWGGTSYGGGSVLGGSTYGAGGNTTYDGCTWTYGNGAGGVVLVTEYY